jgi:hypothetical protein
VVVDALMTLSAAGIRVAQFSLGQPTLDEVFLALTGHRAGDGAPAEAGGAGRRGGAAYLADHASGERKAVLRRNQDVLAPHGLATMSPEEDVVSIHGQSVYSAAAGCDSCSPVRKPPICERGDVSPPGEVASARVTARGFSRQAVRHGSPLLPIPT